MIFANINIEEPLSENLSFSLEGFTIFAIGKDGHIVEFDGEFIEAGTAAYDEFIEKLRKA
jgi:hypothetical protein